MLKKSGSAIESFAVTRCKIRNMGIPRTVCASIHINVHTAIFAKNKRILIPINIGDLVNPTAK